MIQLLVLFLELARLLILAHLMPEQLHGKVLRGDHAEARLNEYNFVYVLEVVLQSFLLHHLAQHTLDEPRFGVRNAHGHVATQPQHIVLRLDKVHTAPHTVLDQLACLPAAIILDKATELAPIELHATRTVHCLAAPLQELLRSSLYLDS